MEKLTFDEDFEDNYFSGKPKKNSKVVLVAVIVILIGLGICCVLVYQWLNTTPGLTTANDKLFTENSVTVPNVNLSVNEQDFTIPEINEIQVAEQKLVIEENTKDVLPSQAVSLTDTEKVQVENSNPVIELPSFFETIEMSLPEIIEVTEEVEVPVHEETVAVIEQIPEAKPEFVLPPIEDIIAAFEVSETFEEIVEEKQPEVVVEPVSEISESDPDFEPKLEPELEPELELEPVSSSVASIYIAKEGDTISSVIGNLFLLTTKESFKSSTGLEAEELTDGQRVEIPESYSQFARNNSKGRIIDLNLIKNYKKSNSKR